MMGKIKLLLSEKGLSKLISKSYTKEEKAKDFMLIIFIYK